MIEAQNLVRRYGDFTAVDDVSFSVGEKEIVGMLGPNGAGKTTTIRMITGFLPPTSGKVTVAGKDLFESPREARRQVGYLPENVALYNEMRVEEYLAYRARLEGLSRPEARDAIGVAVERCLLPDVRRQIIGTLSKGYKQRVGLATAILHRPQVLVLDEPTVGLDPGQIIRIRELIRELGQERTLLLSTHILPEVELLCSRVVIIDRGRIVAQGTPESLRKSDPSLRVTLKDAPADAPEILGRISAVTGVHPSGDGAFTVDFRSDSDIREEVFRTAVERGWVLLELARGRASLEDLFVQLTTHDSAEEARAEETEPTEDTEDSEEVPS
jgi:ABC-2 type transport system ATP-binding protein